MPLDTHIDNGLWRVIAVEDCFECGGFSTYRYFENEEIAWETCSRCGAGATERGCDDEYQR